MVLTLPFFLTHLISMIILLAISFIGLINKEAVLDIVGSTHFKCRLTRAKESPSPGPSSLIREPQKYFDQVIITVCSGDGGHGAILSMLNQRAPSGPQGRLDKGKMRKKSLHKRHFEGSLILPMGRGGM